ncbi:uncharacterized protein Z520_05320 [Fonsecaea multimorphosa CBS 102226]|uniref:Myb-like domain-containing protein n=1 Tax=Fonsecaea multimorphosa CBS 102226 TaxID=1442371 RepID=A0A0D2K6V2_9EURO|nr:uncharacterized protein Z520_05320 [Fonsecaea multimorphosa CBS 102226]KIX98859.1 hypothetical protein Z520_05320 [Fonsecaea multimorphosa CBS 102226]OAL25138.1 hypothetical protein AYO22_05015 [Fonsecaea multimorphosa]
MSFTDPNESFFLDAVASRSRPVVQVLPLNDTTVFEYLDPHPDALLRYLGERPGLPEYFSRTFAQNHNTHGGSAVENVTSLTAGEEDLFGDSVGPIQEFALQHTVEAEQLDDEDGDIYMYLDDDEEANEEEENHNENNNEEVDDSDSASDSNGDEHGYQSSAYRDDESNVGSDGEVNDDAISNEVPSEAGPWTPSSSNTASTSNTSFSSDTATPASQNGAEEGADDQDGNDEQQEGLMPYPAPADLVAASRLGPPTRSWALWEEEACIRHMLNINAERQLTGESRFREALRRMQVHDGVTRTGYCAVKNFWNRVGRARSRFDERRNKKAPLATSKQGKRAERKASAVSRQRRKTARASSFNVKAGNTRHRRSSESSTDENESDYSLQSDDE